MKRPLHDNRGTVTTPLAGEQIDIVGGGAFSRNVTLSSDEARAIERLYGPEAGTNVFAFQASAVANLRRAECDGTRIVAWLARFVEPGTDPLAVVVRAMAETGHDVDPADLAWARGEDGLTGRPGDTR